jgi:Glyoxalase/Bleomycin resistance protein/Dioxygenase superfamily
MGSAPALNRAYMQICWLVPDLEAAIDGWVRTGGVGPFFWFDDVGATEGRHRGKPAEFPTSTAAIAYAGDMQIELVCQENNEAGIFRDLFPRGRYGLHHLAVMCEDYETERDAYVAAGAEVAYEARIGGRTRTCWVDTSPTLGFMVELLEQSRARTMGFAAMRTAAEQWDGKNPITRF